MSFALKTQIQPEYLRKLEELMSNVKLDTSGLDRLIEKLEKVDGEHEVSSDDLFTDNFMSRHTKFKTWKEFVDASSIDDINEVHSEKFSEFVADNSEFQSIEEMEQTAGAEWIKRQLEV